MQEISPSLGLPPDSPTTRANCASTGGTEQRHIEKAKFHANLFLLFDFLPLLFTLSLSSLPFYAAFLSFLFTHMHSHPFCSSPPVSFHSWVFFSMCSFTILRTACDLMYPGAMTAPVLGEVRGFLLLVHAAIHSSNFSSS